MTTVCVLVISNKYGDDVFVCADPDVARRQLERYVDGEWDENMVKRCPGGKDLVWPKPRDVDVKIEQYFEAMGSWESYEIFPDEEVIGEMAWEGLDDEA